MHAVRVHCLGTGDAFSAGGRHQAAYLIQCPSSTLLLDCGSSILASFKRLGLPADSIDAIILSHFHGDHFAGLPFLFLEYIYVEPRRRPLIITGPPGVKSMVTGIFKAMYADSAAEPLPYELEFAEIKPKSALFLNGVEIRAFHAPHQENPVSLGYEIVIAGRKIVCSGDSGWTEDLVASSKNADLLLCECSFFESRLETHLDYPRIAENLARFGAKRVVLTHLGQEVLRRRAEIALEIAYDGLVITL